MKPQIKEKKIEMHIYDKTDDYHKLQQPQCKAEMTTFLISNTYFKYSSR